jgi:hypothetical protein
MSDMSDIRPRTAYIQPIRGTARVLCHGQPLPDDGNVACFMPIAVSALVQLVIAIGFPAALSTTLTEGNDHENANADSSLASWYGLDPASRAR